MKIPLALARPLLLAAALLALPASTFAANGDCGQPVSTGSKPNTSDVLACLKCAVGASCPTPACLCDLNGDGKVRIADVLSHLRRVILPVLPGIDLACNCPPVDYRACSSARLTMLPGSTIDPGWTGIAHDRDLGFGASFDVDILKRCSDSQEPCTRSDDCASNWCVPTCDCNGDVTCEFTGPRNAKRCMTTLESCATNADCPVGVACSDASGPPLPLSGGGTPICVQGFLEQPLTGTMNVATGDLHASTTLLGRINLGIAVDGPCPSCGTPADEPKIGQQFTCSGGNASTNPNFGKACAVHSVTAEFGGTSFDCPPALQMNVMGRGASLRLQDITTGAVTRTAKLPCASLGFKGNPLNAPANPGKCLDNDATCSSNADCTRCTGDSTISCATNGDCAGNGACAEAPDQPISCGYWCSCGFCDGDASLPCFEDGDCTAPQTCKVGTGTSIQQNAPQQKPNDCSGDKFICGLQADEQCANTFHGKCSGMPSLSCQQGTSTCEGNDAGECILENRPCFEPRITRSGDPSPLGKSCASGPVEACSTNADCRRCDGNPQQACSNDADCGSEGPCAEAPCLDSSARPEAVALACMPGTTSPTVNNVFGIAGPAALRVRTLMQVCYCGDGVLGCGETCDDSNAVSGDGCSADCEEE